jgi:hypothetical protein
MATGELIIMRYGVFVEDKRNKYGLFFDLCHHHPPWEW